MSVRSAKDALCIRGMQLAEFGWPETPQEVDILQSFAPCLPYFWVTPNVHQHSIQHYGDVLLHLMNVLRIVLLHVVSVTCGSHAGKTTVIHSRDAHRQCVRTEHTAGFTDRVASELLPALSASSQRRSAAAASWRTSTTSARCACAGHSHLWSTLRWCQTHVCLASVV